GNAHAGLARHAGDLYAGCCRRPPAARPIGLDGGRILMVRTLNCPSREDSLKLVGIARFPTSGGCLRFAGLWRFIELAGFARVGWYDLRVVRLRAHPDESKRLNRT